MASQKQIEANRLNATKSTGPRSVEGKAASSRNALKSGIDAKSQVIFGEDDDHLAALRDEYFDHYRPASPAARALLDTMVECEWLLRRFRTIEAQIWDKEVNDLWQPEDTVILAQAHSHNCDYLERLQRRVNATRRAYRHALNDLEHLQAQPSAEPPPAPVAPLTPRKQPAKAQNGFVPQNLPEPPADAELPAAPLESAEAPTPSDPAPHR